MKFIIYNLRALLKNYKEEEEEEEKKATTTTTDSDSFSYKCCADGSDLYCVLSKLIHKMQ